MATTIGRLDVIILVCKIVSAKARKGANNKKIIAHQGDRQMSQITRRTLLKRSAAGAMAARAAGGLAGILATGKAPALAQTATLHWLRWTDYVPASDQLLRKEIFPECQKALGIKINMENINANDLQARVTSAIQTGTGPDIINVLNNWSQLYGDSTADVDDVCEKIGKTQDGFYDSARAIANDGKRWVAVPWTIVGQLMTYRKSWFAEEGYADGKFPQTWEELRAVGKKLKAKGRPLGQTFGHTYGDAPAFAYPYTWSWGAKEVQEDGKTVVLNSKEAIDAVRFMTGFWKDAYDEGGLAWDDSSNNRAFLSNACAATSNAASIYIEAKKKPESYLTEKGTPLKDDILHAPLPKGPGGQFSFHTPFADMVMKYSKNVDAAKQFLGWIHSNEIYEKWFVSQKGFSVGPTLSWQKSKMWDEDPVMLPFRTGATSGRFAGYAGPSTRNAAEGMTKYILTDMYAKAMQGMAAEQAVAEAHNQLVKIYA